MNNLTLCYVVWPALRALRCFILAGQRALDALPDPDALDPLSATLTVIAALTLGGVLLVACAIANALLWTVEP